MGYVDFVTAEVTIGATGFTTGNASGADTLTAKKSASDTDTSATFVYTNAVASSSSSGIMNFVKNTLLQNQTITITFGNPSATQTLSVEFTAGV